MSGVNDLSDKYKGTLHHQALVLLLTVLCPGVDPVQRAAQATLLASQQTGPSQKRSSSVEGSSTVHSNPLASTVFDSIDANNVRALLFDWCCLLAGGVVWLVVGRCTQLL